MESVLLLAVTSSFLGFVALLAMDLPPRWDTAVNAAGFSATFVFAALLLLFRSVREREHGHGWAWIAYALLLYAAANLWYALEEPLDLPHGVPAIADLLWLCAAPFTVTGVLLLVRPLAAQRGWVPALDTVLVSAGTFTVALSIISTLLHHAPLVDDSEAILFNTADVLADVIVYALALGVAHATQWRPPVWVWMLLGGAALFAAVDALYLVEVAHDRYVEGTWLDVGWPLSAVLLSYAAHAHTQQRLPARADSRSQAVLSAITIPAASAVLMFRGDGPLDDVARAVAFLAVLLAGLRLLVAVRESTTLANELRAARVDTITGLPNTRALRALHQRESHNGVFIAFDLDGLAEINAAHGIGTGDAVLRAVTERLLASTRSTDLVVRLEGDEFGVLIRDDSPGRTTAFAEAVVASLEDEVEVEALRLRISACAGISGVLGSSLDLEQAVGQARAALHDAKVIGTGIVRSFTGGTGVQSQERLRMRTEIKSALRDGGTGFVPFYQPIVSLATGELLAVEALVRWQRGDVLLSPAAFIEEVERSGSMPALTAHMLEQSMRGLRESGIDVPVTVNVPPDLVDALLLHVVRGALATSGSRTSQVIVEVTEDAIMRNPQRANEVLSELRSAGVRVLLDDFGTGWSGLSSLRDLAVDGLKLDASFTRSMHDDPTSGAIVESVAELAARLGVLVIYEGVEEPAQLDRLIEAGSGYVQGFAMARPMSLEQLKGWRLPVRSSSRGYPGRRVPS